MADVKRPTNIEESTYARTVWQVKPEIKVEIEDLLDPNYWAHVASRLKAGDRIEAIPDDRHYYAEFFVLAASNNWAKLVLLRKETLIKDHEKTVNEGFTVEFAGNHKWRVKQGDEILSKGHDDKDAASKWLAEKMKELT
tara:strand:+ start:505 stop:921 length:417 start_codon:yes stop_codon:yes gene_type:complete